MLVIFSDESLYCCEILSVSNLFLSNASFDSLRVFSVATVQRFTIAGISTCVRAYRRCRNVSPLRTRTIEGAFHLGEPRSEKHQNVPVIDYARTARLIPLVFAESFAMDQWKTVVIATSSVATLTIRGLKKFQPAEGGSVTHRCDRGVSRWPSDESKCRTSHFKCYAIVSMQIAFQKRWRWFRALKKLSILSNIALSRDWF